jgi:AcrR family transcriptional regulator
VPRTAKPPDPAERERILQAAVAVLGEVGPLAAKQSQIAARAGVAYGTLYRHFRDRNSLLLAALLDQSHRVEQVWEAASTIADPVERILRICTAPLTRIADVPGLRATLSTGSGGPAAIDGGPAEVARLVGIGESLLRQAIAEAVAGGAFAGLPEDVLAATLLGVPASYLLFGVGPDEPDWEHIASGFDAVLRRLAGR